MEKYLYCADCDEKFDLKSNIYRCRTCGSALETKISTPTISQAPQSAQATEQLSLLERIASHFSEDILRSIQESISGQLPNRSIKESYLKTVGILQVDERNTVLADVCLSVGPLRLLCVIAGFSMIPNANTDIEATLVHGDPECGETDFVNAGIIDNNLLLLKRGKVTFAQKTKRAELTKAKALIISQTEGKWPFLMTDNSQELAVLDSATSACTTIPVVMISPHDATLLTNYLRSAPKTTVILRFAPPPSECAICQDPFLTGQDILKLPCRHVYHCACLSTWLHRHDTCPLCRLQLSTPTSTATPSGNNNANNSHNDNNDFTNPMYG